MKYVAGIGIAAIVTGLGLGGRFLFLPAIPFNVIDEFGLAAVFVSGYVGALACFTAFE